jgi:hypothetical protein
MFRAEAYLPRGRRIISRIRLCTHIGMAEEMGPGSTKGEQRDRRDRGQEVGDQRPVWLFGVNMNLSSSFAQRRVDRTRRRAAGPDSFPSFPIFFASGAVRMAMAIELKIRAGYVGRESRLVLYFWIPTRQSVADSSGRTVSHPPLRKPVLHEEGPGDRTSCGGTEEWRPAEAMMRRAENKRVKERRGSKGHHEAQERSHLDGVAL